MNEATQRLPRAGAEEAVRAASRALRYPPTPAIAEAVRAQLERAAALEEAASLSTLESPSSPPEPAMTTPPAARAPANKGRSWRSRQFALALALLLIVACAVIVYLSTRR